MQYVVDFANGRTGRMHAFERPRNLHQLRDLLRIAARGPSKPEDPDLERPSDEFIDVIRERAGRGIHWKHSLDRASGGAQWRHHAHITDADGFLALIASLLMSESNRDLLGQCHHCGKFFIVRAPARGAPRRIYDSEACRKAANDAGASARQRERRVRLAAMGILKAGKASRDRLTAAVKRAQLENPGARAEQLAEQARKVMREKRK